ncbi:glutaminase A [Kitasatospora sp. NPDC127121]|uniref:glutaminase A n=1 Tax=Kitasatospora sp. NPDC127121 TaxID=3345371 RepID=UPI00363FF7D2
MEPVTVVLAELVERHRADTAGDVARYIPELARADPHAFGLAMVSVQGHAYQAGDAAAAFTIQSVSKPFVYSLALSELGLAEVARRVGFEPSGEPFNAISLEAGTGRPANPLINAGAIVTTALIGGDGEAAFERIRDTLSGFAGRRLTVDEDVYRSEAATGDRNRALAYLTLSQGVLERPAQQACDVYFRQCAIEVTAVDLAVMGATLANGGRNPVTGRRVVDADAAGATLSVMATCGMYDHSGEWMLRVGLPAKSGVGGGVCAVSPGQFGVGVFSPPLDPQGNSVRASAVLRELSAELGLHVLRHTERARSPLQAVRTDHGAHHLELLGDLGFAAAEEIVHCVRRLARDQPRPLVTVDLSHVTAVRPIARRLLADCAAGLRARTTVRFVDPAGLVRRPSTDRSDTPGERAERAE